MGTIVPCAVRTLRPGFRFDACGKPASFSLIGTTTRVCASCMASMRSFPESLFQPIDAHPYRTSSRNARRGPKSPPDRARTPRKVSA